MDFSRFREAARQGCVDGWAASVHWKDSPSPPPAPNYQGAAQATSEGSVQAAIANNLMAHPNITTPLGSQTWQNTGTASIPGVGSTPGFDIPTQSQTISLTPQGQQLYGGQLQSQLGLMGLQQGALDRTSASLNQPFDAGSVGQIADQAYGAQTARLDPQWAQRKEQFDAQMANQGITAGGEAYDNAARDFGQQRNDAYTQARQAAISTMPQTYQLATAARQQPLTELTSLMSGSQPQMPQFQPTQYAMGAQGANMLGAAQASGQYGQGLYNAQVGAQNAETSGLFGLAGSIGQGYAMSPTGAASIASLFSDRRLKSNVVRVGTHRLGIGVYEYDIFGERQRGVMADEVERVLPEAVGESQGYKTVNYGML